MATDRQTALAIEHLHDRLHAVELLLGIVQDDDSNDAAAGAIELPNTSTVPMLATMLRLLSIGADPDALAAAFTRVELDTLALAVGVENPDRLPNKRVAAEHLSDALIELGAAK